MNLPPQNSDAMRETSARKLHLPCKTQKIIYELIGLDGSTTSSELARSIGLSTSQARRTLMKMVEDGSLEACGANKGRTYCLKASGGRASPPTDFAETTKEDDGDLGPIVLLDTDVCIEFLSEAAPETLRICIGLLSETAPETLRTSASLSRTRILIPAPVITELLQFANEHDHPDETLRKTRSFIASYECAPFDGRVAEALWNITGDGMSGSVKGTANDAADGAAGDVVGDAAGDAGCIGYRDKAVAAISIANGGTLLTSDSSRYASIPGIHIAILNP